MYIYLYNVPLTVDVVVQWLINHSFLRPPTPSWLTGSVTNQVLQGQEPIRKVCGESPHQLISIRSEQPFKFLLFVTFSMCITSLSTSSSLSIYCPLPFHFINIWSVYLNKWLNATIKIVSLSSKQQITQPKRWNKCSCPSVFNSF